MFMSIHKIMARGRPRKEGGLRLLLQVRLNDAHMDFINRTGRDQHLTPAEVVRRVLEQAMAAAGASGSAPSAKAPPAVPTRQTHKTPKDPLAGFVQSEVTGAYRSSAGEWEVTVFQRNRMWGWNAHRSGHDAIGDDLIGRARTAAAAARAVRKALRAQGVAF